MELVNAYDALARRLGLATWAEKEEQQERERADSDADSWNSMGSEQSGQWVPLPVPHPFNFAEIATAGLPGRGPTLMRPEPFGSNMTNRFSQVLPLLTLPREQSEGSGENRTGGLTLITEPIASYTGDEQQIIHESPILGQPPFNPLLDARGGGHKRSDQIRDPGGPSKSRNKDATN